MGGGVDRQLFSFSLTPLKQSSGLVLHVCVCVCVCALWLSHVWLFATPWAVAHHALSLGFLRQEYWSGLPFHFPGNFPDPRIKTVSPALAYRFFTTAPPENFSEYSLNIVIEWEFKEVMFCLVTYKV